MKKDNRIIKKLIKDGYVVVLKNSKGKTFPERYNVYKCHKNMSKVVIINDDGEVVALQG